MSHNIPQLLQLQVQAELCRRALAKRSYLEFVKFMDPMMLIGPFQEKMAEIVDEFVALLLAHKEPNFIIEAPPRHGKTTFFSQYLPAFIYLQDPRLFVIHTAYNQTFADDLGRMARNVVSDPRYQDLSPVAAPDPLVNAIDRFDTQAGGKYFAVGMGGALTGRGGHAIIVDDPVKGSDAADSPAEMERQWRWFETVLCTRAMPMCGKLIILTRWTANDIAGRALRLADENPDAPKWRRFSFPAMCVDPKTDLLHRPLEAALDPKRYPREKLVRVRAGMSPRGWSAIYQQNPVPEQGTFFKMDAVEKQVRPVKSFPPSSELAIYIAGDFAIGEKDHNDYTVFWPFGVDEDDNVWMLPDVKRFKGSGGKIIDALLDLADLYSPRELILEDGHIYRALHSTIRRTMQDRGRYYSITSPYPTKDKKARAEPLRARIEQGKLFLPDCPFVRDIVLREAAAFGADKTAVHDDTIDAAALGVGQLAKLMAGRHMAPKVEYIKTDLGDPVNGLTMEQLKARSARVLPQRTYFDAPGNPLLQVPTMLNGRPRT